ncbi:MAG: hypothetical protein MUF31_18450 [Akkermansiaceae bacterium]|nr:hypothetical protein [Akkermansiaceae bacterium]
MATSSSSEANLAWRERKALTDRWLKEQGVPEMRDIWIKLHYGGGSRPASIV